MLWKKKRISNTETQWRVYDVSLVWDGLKSKKLPQQQTKFQNQHQDSSFYLLCALRSKFYFFFLLVTRPRPFLSNLGFLVANLRTFWCTFTVILQFHNLGWSSTLKSWPSIVLKNKNLAFWPNFSFQICIKLLSKRLSSSTSVTTSTSFELASSNGTRHINKVY